MSPTYVIIVIILIILYIGDNNIQSSFLGQKVRLSLSPFSKNAITSLCSVSSDSKKVRSPLSTFSKNAIASLCSTQYFVTGSCSYIAKIGCVYTSFKKIEKKKSNIHIFGNDNYLIFQNVAWENRENPEISEKKPFFYIRKSVRKPKKTRKKKFSP